MRRFVQAMLALSLSLFTRPVVCLGEASKSKFFGDSWPIPFKENSQTLPSVEIKLAPPEDPLPQISAEIQLLERARMRMEEGIMAKLEDEYNRQLDKAQKEIQDAVNQAMKVFDDPDILRGAVQGALIPASNPSNPLKTALSKQNVFKGSPFFRQLMNTPSFIETAEKTETSSKFLGTLLPKNNPNFRVEITDINEPDSKIKTKMDEIEQKRADEEAKLFEAAIAEFDQLTKITVQELEKSIQIEMNPFLVDTPAVTSLLREALPLQAAQVSVPQAMAPRFETTLESGEAFLNLKCFEAKHKHQSLNLNCQPDSFSLGAPTSFLQQKESSHDTETERHRAPTLGGLGGAVGGLLQGAAGAMEKQLNVKIGQSDMPYPTADELVSNMEMKRDATERLERMKVLELEMRLLKAEDEMIKDALRSAISRTLAQYGPTVDSIKREITMQQLT